MCQAVWPVEGGDGKRTSLFATVNSKFVLFIHGSCRLHNRPGNGIYSFVLRDVGVTLLG
jgi:hypothetical protein